MYFIYWIQSKRRDNWLTPRKLTWSTWIRDCPGVWSTNGDMLILLSHWTSPCGKVWIGLKLMDDSTAVTVIVRAIDNVEMFTSPNRCLNGLILHLLQDATPVSASPNSCCAAGKPEPRPSLASASTSTSYVPPTASKGRHWMGSCEKRQVAIAPPNMRVGKSHENHPNPMNCNPKGTSTNTRVISDVLSTCAYYRWKVRSTSIICNKCVWWFGVWVSHDFHLQISILRSRNRHVWYIIYRFYVHVISVILWGLQRLNLNAHSTKGINLDCFFFFVNFKHLLWQIDRSR